MKGFVRAQTEANALLERLGYVAVFCGLTSRGCALATRGPARAVTCRVASVSGALVWFGVDRKSGYALYHLQPLEWE